MYNQTKNHLGKCPAIDYDVCTGTGRFRISVYFCVFLMSEPILDICRDLLHTSGCINRKYLRF